MAKRSREFKTKSILDSLFIPVVTAQEMARLERLAVAEGASAEKFMLEAGRKVALVAQEWIDQKKLLKKVVLLVGKGNNGGDAYVAGICLLEEGIRVKAFALYPSQECSALNRKFREKFLKKRGVVKSLAKFSELNFEEEGLILDGLLGTGFKGNIEPLMAKVIEAANVSGKPILAIDIPSGLNGTSGEADNQAIIAKETIALGFPKSGFFLRDGWNKIGNLRVESFNLPKKFQKMAEIFGCVPDLKCLSSLLPSVIRNRHKYQAGYVIGFGGSRLFRGAPKLTGLAALHSGAGIVRIFHKEEIGEAPFELICQKWSEKEWRKELKRANAIFIGPGIGQSKETLRFLKSVLKNIDLPIVLDADALQQGVIYPKRSILTPHRQEVLRLLGIKKDTMEEDLLARCQKWVDRRKNILILKGAPTFIFSSDRPAVIIPHGDPGMATAGAGDVLTGILSALLAQKMGCFEAAVLGVTLHALAGESAAKEKTSYAVIAEDLIAYLPQAFQKIIP